ncbi:hypothetical protein BRD09_05660 [Halobacteriales archaeon SW_10_68_16]|jgi:predicted nuclease of predicted toxin-antitoxin system|nr:MAG: hypothetical protein BRD09_05660 [Halobacteriales archaeon SW_10_68_16]
MSLSLLLDENIEHEVLHRLRERGYDVEHVDTHPSLDKGVSDDALARHSLEAGRIIVSYDPDWVTDFSEDEYHCVLLFEDQSLSSRQVVQIVYTMSETYPESAFRGLQKVGRSWLSTR